MSGPGERSPRVVVVGGGVSGLAAAHRLRTLLGDAASITVLESARVLGGKLAAVDLGGLRVDVGAEAFLARRPEAAARLTELGLADEIVHPSAASSAIRAGGATHAMPRRTVMGVPTDPPAVADLLSPAGRAALEAEDAMGPLDWEGDDSVGGLVRARFGDEVADRLVDPLLGGVYSGRADSLGVRATVPALADALDRGAPSLRAAAAAALPAAPVEGTAPAPVFGTLRTGLADLPPALAVAARAQVRLARTVTGLARTDDGWRLTVSGPAGEEACDADAVVLAVPAPGLRRLLDDVAPAASRAAAGIELASSAVVALAVPPGTDLGERSGVLVGSGERRPDGTPWTIKAVTVSSVKWPHLVGDSAVVLRASVGRFGDTGVLQRDDDDLVAAVRSDLAALIGLDVEPVETVVARWGGGLPQYGVGHGERVADLERAVAAVPGLAVAGAALHGVGVPACLATGDAAAERVAASLAGLSGNSERRAPSVG
ncbi:protoporphyrinogen oxidase [Actinomycetospora endophytica]|uniref:Coproporphyrinogen III oxidase n=1 Tax=Actinomycetospora endophytica TaxID=2291215 RepID=A0ABS8PEV7_9PSEU|nr:protoporphyrinogen oxidase [Actinomycetospora endophytica]MCD2196808.1 protoporphyrinogen oxidase [Actinomycetospora endophytica]